MTKQLLRREWRIKRQSVSRERRKEAEDHAFEDLQQRLSKNDQVLSFASFSCEFSTKKINKHLGEQKQLFLPKINGERLDIYSVNHPEIQCQINRQGILEPIAEKCIITSPEQITVALIPGLVFDSNHHRLGYGKGYYDRFLLSLPLQTQTFGLGFTEQLSKTPLPTDPHDVTLSGLLLF